MIPIKQTVFPGKEQRGNSMSACYASYFDKKLKECPAFQDIKPKEIDEWIEGEGYETESLKQDPYNRGEVEDDYYIAFGVSPRREDFYHFVIMHEGKLFHDPNPEGGGIEKIEGHIYFERIYDTLPEKEDDEPDYEEPKAKEVIEKPSIQSIDEKTLEKLGIEFAKKDAYTGRGLFKLLLVKSPMAEITITAQRLSSLVDHPDKDAWLFVYNEVGKGNSRMSRKIYFEEQAAKFVSFFKWMNNID